MPLAVSNWINDLEIVQQNISAYFNEQLQEAHAILEPIEYELFCNTLESGIKEALSKFIKWMEIWIHLPLSICSLGGSKESAFASAFLLQDIKKGIEDTLGLRKALEDSKFFEELKNFVTDLFNS
ncbi:1274_t:CDS:2, partial [Gigaspora rosea]